MAVDPENAEAVSGLDTAAQRAAVSGAAVNLKRAETELAHGQVGEAARFFARAAAGMPDDAAVHRKAADALVRAKGDLHKAAELARRAVALASDDAEARATLADVYLAMLSSWGTEIEGAGSWWADPKLAAHYDAVHAREDWR